MSRKTIVEYDVLRVIVTLLVLLGHCAYWAILTPFGGCDYSQLMGPGAGSFYRCTVLLKEVIYTFHMPLYMALSGALLRHSTLQRGGERDRDRLAGKAKKLLVPFLVVTLCYSVPLKYLSGYYAGSQDLLKDVLLGQVLLQGNTHLWFLPVLFTIFLLFHPLERRIPLRWRIKLPFLLVLSIGSDLIPVQFLQLVLRHLFWFCLGYCFEDKRAAVDRRIASSPLRTLALWGAGFLALIAVRMRLPGKGPLHLLSTLLSAPQAIAGCYIAYAVSYLLSRTNLPNAVAFQKIRANTLGLYLYSDPLNYVILALAARFLGRWAFATVPGAAALYLARFVVSSLAAYGVSRALKRLGCKYLA